MPNTLQFNICFLTLRATVRAARRSTALAETGAVTRAQSATSATSFGIFVGAIVLPVNGDTIFGSAIGAGQRARCFVVGVACHFLVCCADRTPKESVVVVCYN